MTRLTTKLQFSEKSNHYSTSVPFTAASMLGIEKGAEVVWELQDGQLVGRVGGDD